jgi:hypothetical protein
MLSLAGTARDSIVAGPGVERAIGGPGDLAHSTAVHLHAASGSTFLREFLAKDAENRAPRVWEVMFPVPAQNGVGVPFFLKRKQANHSPQKPNLKKTDYQPHIYP